MLLQPAFGGLQLAGRIAATEQAVEAHQVIVKAAFERAAHGLFGLLSGPQPA
ncbi:hypothetical protein D3C80_2209590 [compost metagenome]